MIMFIVWMLLAVFAGIALYIVMPWTAAKIAGEEWVEWVSDAYVWLAQTAAHKSAIIERDGTLELISKRFDSEILGDKDKEHGDPRHHRDEFDVLSRLQNKSFGVALGNRAEYVSPLLAGLGEKAWRLCESGDLGRKGESKMRDGIIVGPRSKLADLAKARHLTTGDADPEDGHESYLWTQISQERFNEKLSFGQTMVIVIGALGSMGLMYYLTTQGTGSGSSTTVSLLALLVTLKGADIRLRDAAAGLWVLGWITIWPFTALLMEGLVTGILVTVVMGTVAAIVPAGIALAGPSIPKSVGLILARGHWILAQLSVGRGILVRRSTGAYEHHLLREADDEVTDTVSMTVGPGEREIVTVADAELLATFDSNQCAGYVALEAAGDTESVTADVKITVTGSGGERSIYDETLTTEGDVTGGVELPDGEIDAVAVDADVTVERDLDHEFVTTLSDGTELPVSGTEGDLYRFAWAPLGVTEEKGERNMGPITQTPPTDIQTDGGYIMPKNTRQGYRPVLPVPDADEWLVTLPQLWSWCQGTSESRTIEQGRDKALSEHGGAQQVSMMWFSVVVLTSVVVGGLFGWIAAGGPMML